jgi:hypothetical protein
MVAKGEEGDPEGSPAVEARSYLIDMSEEMARLSLRAGAPAAAMHFLEAARALRQLQANAAPGDAA